MPNTLKRKTRKLWFSPNGDKLQHYQESSIMTLDASYSDSNNHPAQSKSNNHDNNIHDSKTMSIISHNQQQSKPKKKWFAKRNVNAIQSTPEMIPTQYYYYHNQQSIVDHYHHHQHYPPQEDSNQFHTIIETNKIPKRSNRTKWYVMNVHPQPSSSSSHNPALSAESTKTTANNHNYNHNHSNAHIIPAAAAAAEYSSCSQSIISSKCPSSHNTAVLNFSGEGGSSKVITSNTRFSQHTNHHHYHNNKSISSSKRKYRSRFKLCPSLLWVCSITTTTKSNKKLSGAGVDGGAGGAGGNDEKNSQSEDVPQKHVDWKDRLFLLRKQPHYVGAGAGAGVGSKVGNNLDSTTGTTSLSTRTTLQKKRGRRLYGGGLLCRLEEGSECSFSENRIH